MAGFVGGEVALTGTTWATVVAAPGAAEQREVLRLAVWNRDTEQRTVKTRKKIGASNYELFPELVLAAGQKGLVQADGCVLDNTDETIEMSTDATAATTEPLVDVGVFEVP
jgi:hypothetical protein